MSTEGKNSSNNEPDWRNKLNDIVQTCQTEIKKTTQIGMKMLSASQSNVQLHEAYEELGKWLVSQVDNGSINVTDEEILALIAKVKHLENELENFEQDVQDLKSE